MMETLGWIAFGLVGAVASTVLERRQIKPTRDLMAEFRDWSRRTRPVQRRQYDRIVAKYPPSMTAAEIVEVEKSLETLRTTGYAMMPEGVDLVPIPGVIERCDTIPE